MCQNLSRSKAFGELLDELWLSCAMEFALFRWSTNSLCRCWRSRSFGQAFTRSSTQSMNFCVTRVLKASRRALLLTDSNRSRKCVESAGLRLSFSIGFGYHGLASFKRTTESLRHLIVLFEALLCMGRIQSSGFTGFPGTGS
jgi:hypothetical protein